MMMTGLHFVPCSLNLDIPFGSLKKSLKAKTDTTSVLSIGANKKSRLREQTASNSRLWMSFIYLFYYKQKFV